MVVTPALELAERDEHELAAWNELDDGLDTSLEGVEAHAEAGGGFLAAEEQSRDRLERAAHRAIGPEGAGG